MHEQDWALSPLVGDLIAVRVSLKSHQFELVVILGFGVVKAPSVIAGMIHDSCLHLGEVSAAVGCSTWEEGTYCVGIGGQGGHGGELSESFHR